MIPSPHFIQWTILFFGLLAFSSATHDIAADGFYILATTEHQQSFFIGWRSIFFNAGKIAAQGGLIFLAGNLARQTGNPALAWSSVFAVAAAIFFGLGAYHRFILPRPAVDQPREIPAKENFFDEFLKTFAAFFRKPKIILPLLFILLYRLGEAQLVKIIPIFLHAPPARAAWDSIDERISRDLRHDRRHRFHVRRAARRIRRGAAGLEILALADVAGDSSAGRGVHLARLRAAGKSCP